MSAGRLTANLFTVIIAVFCYACLASPLIAQEKVDLEKLTAQFKDRDFTVRRSAVEALGDEYYNVRASAALALGDLGDKRAVEPLLPLLRSNDNDSVRIGVVVSLGALGDKRAIEPLEKLLKTEKNGNVRSQIEYALQRLNANQLDKQ